MYRLVALLVTLISLAHGAVATDVPRAQLQVRLQIERQRIEATARSVATRMPAPANAVDVTKEFNVPNDGQAPAAAAINRAINQANGRALYFPAGTYRLENSIRPVSDTKLYFSPDAELQRGFDGGNGDARGALIQGAPSFVVHDVVIVGGQWSNPGNRYAGRVLTAIGSHWTIDSVRVTSWAPQQAASSCFNLAGDDITVRNCVLTGSMKKLNQDGIRLMCGTRIRVSDCYVESGDDAFCAFPPEVDKVALSRRDLSDVIFERCFGFSGAARFLACGMTSAVSLQIRKLTLADLNRAKVHGLHFIDCVGLSLSDREHAPAFFVVCANPNPGVSVDDITFTRCRGVSGPSAAQAILITATDGSHCAHVRLEKCEAFGGQKEPVAIGRACSDVHLVDTTVNGIAVSR